MSEKKPYTPVIQWREAGTGTAYQECQMRSPRRDPTANAAIGNIMREERRKKRKQEAQEKSNPQRRKNPYHTRVWRAEDEASKPGTIGGVGTEEKAVGQEAASKGGSQCENQ